MMFNFSIDILFLFDIILFAELHPSINRWYPNSQMRLFYFEMILILDDIILFLVTLFYFKMTIYFCMTSFYLADILFSDDILFLHDIILFLDDIQFLACPRSFPRGDLPHYEMAPVPLTERYFLFFLYNIFFFISITYKEIKKDMR